LEKENGGKGGGEPPKKGGRKVATSFVSEEKQENRQTMTHLIDLVKRVEPRNKGQFTYF